MWWPVAVPILLLLQSADFTADGLKALEEKKYAVAEQAFTKAVEADPKDYSAHFHLALTYSLEGKTAEAIAGYKTVLELKPGLYEAELNLGILMLRQKDWAQAVQFLQPAVEKKPKEFRPNFHLAEALYRAGQFGQAEQYYRAAAELNPKEAAAEAGLARAIARQGRVDEAAGHYRRAAELDPDYRDALLELASLYEEKKRLPEAIAIYQQFTEQPAVQERLGELLLRTGKVDAAIEQLELVVKRSPTAANRFMLATAYLEAKQLDKAVPLLAQAVQADPNNFDLRMMYGRALRDQKNYQAAAREFWGSAQARPGSKEAWSELAGMLILLENYPQALAALDRMQALGEDTAAVHYFRAIVLDRLKQYKPALENYEKFLAMSTGKNPDEEFKARQRIRVIQKELSKR